MSSQMKEDRPFADGGPTTPTPVGRPGQAHGPTRRLITLAQAADLLGMSTASVRRLIWAGKLHIVKLNRRVLVDLRDLDRLIEQAKDCRSW